MFVSNMVPLRNPRQSRERGKPAAVLMSLEDFASYAETHHLMQSPRNAARLLEAVADLDRG